MGPKKPFNRFSSNQRRAVTALKRGVNSCEQTDRASRLSQSPMNPDKLFDYLDGKLPPSERAELEEQLMADAQLRRELVTAREIHSGMRKSSEVLDEPIPGLEQRGAILGRRVAIAFSVLVFAN